MNDDKYKIIEQLHDFIPIGTKIHSRNYYLKLYLICPIIMILLYTIAYFNWQASFDSFRYWIASFIVIGVYGFVFIILPVLLVMIYILSILLTKKLYYRIKLLSKEILIINCIIVPAIVAGVSFIPATITPKPYNLLITDNIGNNNIPDYALYWQTENPSINNVELFMYDSEGNIINNVSIHEASSRLVHLIKLKDLLPNTKYGYRVNTDNIYNFTTPNPLENILFYCLTDIHYSGSTLDKAKLLYQKALMNNANYMFLSGDITNFGFDYQWNSFFDDILPYTRQIPMRTCIGNHDAQFNGRQSWSYYLSPKGMDNESTSQFYTYIRLNNYTNLIMLDLEWGMEQFTREQENWMKNVLNNINSTEWTIIMSHCPIIDLPKMINIIQDYDVDLLISGHTHELNTIYYETPNNKIIPSVECGSTTDDMFITPGMMEFNLTRSEIDIKYHTYNDEIINVFTISD